MKSNPSHIQLLMFSFAKKASHKENAIIILMKTSFVLMQFNICFDINPKSDFDLKQHITHPQQLNHESHIKLTLRYSRVSFFLMPSQGFLEDKGLDTMAALVLALAGFTFWSTVRWKLFLHTAYFGQCHQFLYP